MEDRHLHSYCYSRWMKHAFWVVVLLEPFLIDAWKVDERYRSALGHLVQEQPRHHHNPQEECISYQAVI